METSKSAFALSFAVGCSAVLTLITIRWSFAPTEWAQLNSQGVYIPQSLPFPPTNTTIQIALWLGMVGGLWLAAREHRPRSHAHRSISHYGSIVVITLLGFGLRLHTLGELPFIIDEIGFAAHASDILHGQGIPLFAPGHNAMPVTTSWLMAGAMALFGQTTFAARLVPLGFATLSIPAIYMLGRTWWSRRTGLIAAAFLATYPAHVHFSQFALNNLIDPLFAMLALVFLTRARHTGFRGDYVLAGMLAGTAQYFYQGARLLLVLMLVYWLFTRTAKSPTDCKRLKSHGEILWLILPMVLLSLPRFAPMLVAGLSISGNTRPIELPPDWQTNAIRSILAWVNQPDVSPFWLSETHLLELPALLAFTIGVFVALRHWRDERHIVILLYLPLTTIFGGVIWASAPLFIRYMTAVPAIAPLIALGIERLNRIRAISPRLSVSVLVIGIIAVQGGFVALRHTSEAHAHVTDSQWREHVFAQQAADLPPENAAVLVMSTPFAETQQITVSDYVAALGKRRVVVINNGDSELLARQIEQLDQAYRVIQLP
ncbi:MAG TPA: glycosyltransferase family 39 protein [Oceanobacillus sp.]|nr:glycosyltransferase family 39 protein [Oceanobacillus sp.]